MAAWLRELIKSGLIPQGVVDERSIVEVKAKEVKGFTQCHFFAGIGGWSLALQLAGIPSTEKIWTGSCPCQSFSSAGERRGAEDERHLWPHLFRLIRECKPVAVVGEQVDKAVRFGWLDGVQADVEAESYTFGAVVLGAHSVRSPHKRNRIWWVAESSKWRREAVRIQEGWRKGRQGKANKHRDDKKNAAIPVAAGNRMQARGSRPIEREERKPDRAINGGVIAGVSDAQGVGYAYAGTRQHQETDRDISRRRLELCRQWNEYTVIEFTDGTKRRSQPGVRCLAHGISNRVAKVHGLGNAICPQTAAAFLIAWQQTKGVV